MVCTLAWALIPALWGTATPQDSASLVRLVPQSSQNLVMDIQESADGTRLLTHDRKLAPRLWDSKSLKLLLVLRGHRDPVDWLSFSPDGKTIATLSKNQVLVWDSTKAKQVETLTSTSGNEFVTACFAPDSSSLVLGTKSGGVGLHRLRSGQPDLVIPGHKGPVLDLKITPDGRTVVSGGQDKTVRACTLSEPGNVRVFELPEGAARWVDVSRDGTLISATTLTGRAAVFDLAKGKRLYTKPHVVSERSVGNVQMGALFVGQPESLLTATKDGPLVLSDPRTGDERTQLVGHQGSVREIRVSPNRARIATAGDDGALYVWELKDGSKLPFKLGGPTPTAGEFSWDSNVFWVGYDDGAIRAHDLKTGEFRTEALGSVLEMYACVPVAGGRLLAQRWPRGWWVQKALTQNESKFLRTSDYRPPVFAPNGKTVLYPDSEDSEFPWHLVNLETGRTVMRYKDVSGVRYNADSNQFVTRHTDSTVNVWSSETGNLVKAWQLDKTRAVNDVLVQPGTGLLVSHSVGDSEVMVWDPLTAEVKARLPIQEAGVGWFAMAPDGQRLAVYNKHGVTVWLLANGQSLDIPVVNVGSLDFSRIAFSPDSRKVLVRSEGHCRVWSAINGKLLLDVEDAEEDGTDTADSAFSPDSSRVVTRSQSHVRVYSVESGQLQSEFECVEEVRSAFFIEKGSRILTCDASEGVTVWDASSNPVKRLGNIVAILNFGWLVYDESGRFDAADPSEVVGANFVKEWEGGLEAISMDQLKSSYYEPGLFGKLLGFDPEPPREVPDLEALRLFPTVTIKQSQDNPLLLKVSLTERDDGGIGKVNVFMNGKQLLRKNGVGFFDLDLTEQQAFFLPETLQKEGNWLQVTASNREGTLTSPPVTLNVGFPPGLKVPEVNMHVLAVGVGDYVGQAGDLQSPPSDASAFARALDFTSSRLLPGKVHVTEMSTRLDALHRPTRHNILAWFDDLARSASSSDIVVVFLSGHGTNQIGDQKGYFFLTSEADPGDLSPSSIATSTISADDLKERLSRIPASKQVVILDSCHSGAASQSLLGATKSVGGDYQRAWESIKDATGTWMLAGSAADQLSYESPNVEHGVLTYSLLEALDKVSAEGMRPGTGDEYFLDVERWLRYASERVESLKAEIGLGGIQRPEFKRSTNGTTFDLGVAKTTDRGHLNLKPPKPVVIVGEFEHEKEDPAGFEDQVRNSLRDSQRVKAWFDVSKHPSVYRVAGEYTWSEEDTIRVKVYVQRFDAEQKRRNQQSFVVEGSKRDLPGLSAKVRAEIERRVLDLETARLAGNSANTLTKPPD